MVTYHMLRHFTKLCVQIKAISLNMRKKKLKHLRRGV